MANVDGLQRIHLKCHGSTSGEGQGRYASIDKPYNRFYVPEDQRAPIPEKTIYQTIFDNNQDNLNETALVFGDEEVTFRELFSRIDKIAHGLQALGVAEGDVVSAAMVSTPDAVALLYATSKVGATFASMDPRDSTSELRSKLEQAKPKCLFVATGFEKVADIASEGLVETIVSLSSNVETMSFEAVAYEDFLNKGTDVLESHSAAYRSDHVAAIVYTGASTGAAKGVMLSDYSFNAMGVALMNSGYQFAKAKRFLDVLPLFIAYGVCNALHVPLMWGETIVLVDPFKIDRFAGFVFKYKPQHIYASPPHIRFLQYSDTAKDADLSFLEFVASGGAGMPYEEDAGNYLFFAAHGADGVYGQGYGLTEINAAFCYGIGRKNKIGYIGIPLAGNDAAIVDADTLEELPFGEGLQGLLMIKTPTVMLGYHGLAASKNKDVFVVDDAGERWVATGDVCVMDTSGKIKIIDRVGRGFNTYGMNIYPSVIEDVLGMHRDVMESVVVGLEHELMGAAPVANVVVAAELLERVDALADELDELISRELPSYTRIYAYRFRTSLPYTSRAKPNYQLILSQGIDRLGDDVLVIREAADIEDVLGAE